MPAKNAYLDFVVEQLSILGDIRSRSMMGGYCLYCDGFVFALLAGNTLYLKADDRNRARFDNCGLKAFRPFDGPGTMSYYEAPPKSWKIPMRCGPGAVVQSTRAVSLRRNDHRRRSRKELKHEDE